MRSAVAAALVAAAAFLPAGASDAEREYEVAARTILCDCGCPPQSVHDCACGRAAEMRGEMRAMVASGRTGAQVVDAYVAKHGERIRIAPTATGFNLLAWLGPGAALVLGAGFVVVVIRRWQRSPGAEPPPGSPRPPGEDDPYLAKVKASLQEYE